jgi:hypothetical protein
MGADNIHPSVAGYTAMGEYMAPIIVAHFLPPAPTVEDDTDSGTVGVAYSYAIQSVGSPTSYNATGLPDGLSVDTVTGIISGTPTIASSGIVSVTISATNSTGTGTGILSLIIYAAPTNASVMKRSLLRVETTIDFQLNLGITLSTAVDISKYVVNLGDITEKLSKSSTNSGGVLLPNLNIKLDNQHGRFNRDSGYFKNGFINGSLITITTHYIGPDNAEITPEFVFKGLIKYASCEWDRTQHVFEATIIPGSSLLATEKVQPGILSHTTFKNICYQILHRAPFTKYLTVSLANFTMGWDVTQIDSYADFTHKKVKDVLDEIMLMTGSIYYVNYAQEFIIEPAIPASATSVCAFRGDDIEKISSEKYDWKGQYTAIKWDDDTNPVMRTEMTYPVREIYQYDFVELKLTSEAVTDLTNRALIMTNLLEMYKYLKREIVLTCKWNPDVSVNDYITLDVAQEAVIGDEFLTWNEDQWNDGKFWGIESPGISFSSSEFWRVIAVKRDTEGKNMQLTLVQQYSDDEK